MNKPFKIRMLRTLQFGHAIRPYIFFKGRTYTAWDATNQSNWKSLGMVFVRKAKQSGAVPLVAGDYEKIT